MKDDDFIIMAIDHTSDDPRPVELGDYIRREIRLFIIPAWMFYTDECRDCSCKIAHPGRCDRCWRELGIGD